MKYAVKISLIILSMFLLTQFIGLFIVNSYSPKTIINQTGQYENITPQLPYGLQPPKLEAGPSLISLLISFVIAIMLILVLSKYKWKFLIRAWFFVVVALALAIAFNAILKNIIPYSYLFVLILAIPLAFIKIYKPNVLMHNFTELLIYPGISAVFVPILAPLTIIILLVLISIYDMWMVWKTGIMQKMAKFQLNELHIFGGFMIPYMSKKVKMQMIKLKKLKRKSKKKIKISLAILGGGDVVFPIITAGVFLRDSGLLSAIIVIAGAFLGLSYLLLFYSQKGKSYPAMPFITAGIFVAIIISRLTGVMPYIIKGLF